MSYLGLCLAGEAGEAANIIKKIVRGGGNQGATEPELVHRLVAEIVDVGIYLCEFIDMFANMGINFDEAWDAKFNELRARPYWKEKELK